MGVGEAETESWVSVFVWACGSNWDRLFFICISSLHVLCCRSWEVYGAVCLKGYTREGKGGSQLTTLSHGYHREREREIVKNCTTLLLLLITGQRYCQGLFLFSFLFSLLKKFVLTSQKNKKIIRRTLKALLDTIKLALIG